MSMFLQSNAGFLALFTPRDHAEQEGRAVTEVGEIQIAAAAHSYAEQSLRPLPWFSQITGLFPSWSEAF